MSLSPTLPEKSEGEREKKWEGESSKVTFGVSPLELVSSWQGRDSFNFSSTVRSSLFFKRLWDRYKQRKILPDFFGIIWGPLSSQALSLCQKWAFSDSCQISAADGLLGSQIEQSFPRYCKSRPGCFSTCFCPSVIDKSYWMTVWQTPHLWFLVEWARKKKTKREQWLLRGARSVARWTFFDHLLNQKYSKRVVFFFQVWWRHGSESFDVTLWTSSSGLTDFHLVAAFIVLWNNSPRGRMACQKCF